MKKVVYFLICLILFTSCNKIVLRKDRNERVTFSKSFPQGEYNIYLYKLNYPDSQKEKLIFMSNFVKILESQSDNKNYILSKKLYDDVNSVISRNGIGTEKAFFKSVSFIDNNDKKIINKLVRNIRVPKDSGEIQMFLNKQCYYLLSLLNREDEYLGDFYYTEFDKENLISEYTKDRKNMRDIFLTKKKNFLVALKNEEEIKNYKNDMIYLDNYSNKFVNNILDKKDIELNVPLILIDDYNYKGYTMNNETLVLFPEYGREKLSYFIGYDFNVIIIKSDDLNGNFFVKDDKKLEISDLLNRRKYVPKRPL